jgi:hypothetical protein
MWTAGGGGCSLNTNGITDFGPGNGGNGGDVTGAHVGAGGTTGAGTGGASATGAGGTTGALGTGTGGSMASDGTGGATALPGDGGASGTGGASAGTGGANAGTGTGGATINGTGGASGTGGVGIGGKTGTGGMMGVGGNILTLMGCADGTREAFTSTTTFPSIAGCAGGWSVAGVLTTASNAPACSRAGGNDGARPNGAGCTVEDLCAAGWHVCRGAAELTTLGVRCADARLPALGMGALFYATRQRGVQGVVCNADDTTGTNDVHGCGNFGLAEGPGCAPLDRQLSHTECTLTPPWSCGDNNTGTNEALLVTKATSTAGGVLCCK